MQLYFECGPSFILTKINDEEEAINDISFTTYHHNIFGDGGFTIGLNFKIGIDIIVTRSISLSFFVMFMKPNFKTFFNNIANNTKNYFLYNGYVGFKIVL